LYFLNKFINEGKFLDTYLTGRNFNGEARFPSFKLEKPGYYMIKYHYNFYCPSACNNSDGYLTINFNYGSDNYQIRHNYNNIQKNKGEWILNEFPLLIKPNSSFNVNLSIFLTN